ncbi:MAG TPA: hypothetical protein PKE12_07700 [Kiritimatiellia bacterium]|nr:hypothetical protein [Kiritimatiellia bacterium]
MNRNPAWLAPAALIALALFAVGAAVYAVRETPGRLRQIERRHAEWIALRDQSARRAAERDALAYATRAGASPPLPGWLREQRPAWKTEVREAERERITPDWSLQRVQVTIDRVNLVELGETLATLAALPAPWRAVEITIAAEDGGPGRGRATLVMEGLVRAPVAGS